jgi:hypothetical protein
MEENIKTLVAQCEETANRRCFVADYYGGASYRLVQTFEIKDVRMVYAPPMSVGQFGGDVDNWMWPRHSADFAFIRAYVAPDGSSATYSPDNVPYEPPHTLTVNTEGVAEGDMVFVAGFPGRTNRHLLSQELAYRSDVSLPRTIDRLTQMLAVLDGHAASSPEARARLGASISGYRNYLKNSQGMLAGLRQVDVVEIREAEEQAIRAVAGRAAQKNHDELVAHILEGQAERDRMEVLRSIRYSSSLYGVAYDALRWAQNQAKPDDQRELGYQERDRERRTQSMVSIDKRLWLPAEQDTLRLTLGWYEAAPPEQRIAALDDWLEQMGGSEAAIEALYSGTRLGDAEARLALLEQSVAELEASEDPFISLAVAMETFFGPHRELQRERSGRDHRLRSAWMSMKLDVARSLGRPVYSDANGTLRLTFGHVQGYRQQDALQALPFTTLEGLAAKAGDAPFDAPSDYVAAARTGADSQWAVPSLGDVPVNFLSDLDITGGNSGSAILDAQGQLVGLAFDGNWESIVADWMFLDDVTRCIGVDVRYMMWNLEQEPQAARILRELGVTAAAP